MDLRRNTTGGDVCQSAPGHYLALVTKEEDSDWNVVFPDLPGCVTAGRSLDEAVAFAEEALALHVHGLREGGDAPPVPSDIEDVMADPSRPAHCSA